MGKDRGEDAVCSVSYLFVVKLCDCAMIPLCLWDYVHTNSFSHSTLLAHKDIFARTSHLLLTFLVLIHNFGHRPIHTQNERNRS